MRPFVGMASALATWWFLLLGGGTSPASPPSVTWVSVAAVVVGFALLVAVAALTGSRCLLRHRAEGAALRQRARRVAVVSQRDPDARGRTRPRAPTCARRGDVLVAAPGC